MTKREFLSELNDRLSYELPSNMVEENVRYYSDYIDQEVRAGRSIDTVLADLGDPKLIAKTIADAEKSGADGIPNTSDDRNYEDEIYNRKTSQGSYDSGSYSSGNQSQRGGYSSDRTGSSGSYDRNGSGSFGGRSSSGSGRPGGFGFPSLGCLTPLLFFILFNAFITGGLFFGGFGRLLLLIMGISAIKRLIDNGRGGGRY